MRNEYLTFAELTDQERSSVSLPSLDAGTNALDMFWGAIEIIKARRGEQPDSPALPADGALRGDVPLSSTERIEV